jgi:hypothetical protein
VGWCVPRFSGGEAAASLPRGARPFWGAAWSGPNARHPRASADEDGHACYGNDAIHVGVCEAFDLPSIVQATDDCRSFCEYVTDWDDDDQRHSDRSWRAARQALAGMDPAEAGANFWLTRERHGTGFWDRGLGAAGDCLTSAAHTFGDAGMHVGDDGRASLS